MPTQCPLHTGEVRSYMYHENILTCFKAMVRTIFLQFWRQGEITHGPSQLETELSFLYLTPLPNALYNLTIS